MEKTQMEYENAWDSLVEQHAKEDERYDMKRVVWGYLKIRRYMIQMSESGPLNLYNK